MNVLKIQNTIEGLDLVFRAKDRNHITTITDQRNSTTVVFGTIHEVYTNNSLDEKKAQPG